MNRRGRIMAWIDEASDLPASYLHFYPSRAARCYQTGLLREYPDSKLKHATNNWFSPTPPVRTYVSAADA